MNNRGSLIIIGLAALLCISVLTTATTIYFYQESASVNQLLEAAQSQYSSIRTSVIQVNIKIDYVTGDSDTYNTYLAPKTTVFDALKTVAEVDATYWQEYQSWLINAINGVVSNENNNNAWWVYSVNGEHAIVSADAYELKDGDRVEWTYQQY